MWSWQAHRGVWCCFKEVQEDGNAASLADCVLVGSALGRQVLQSPQRCHRRRLARADIHLSTAQATSSHNLCILTPSSHGSTYVVNGEGYKGHISASLLEGRMRATRISPTWLVEFDSFMMNPFLGVQRTDMLHGKERMCGLLALTKLSRVGIAPAALRAAWPGAWAEEPSDCCEGVTMWSMASEAPSATRSFLDSSSRTKSGTAPAAAISCKAHPPSGQHLYCSLVSRIHLLAECRCNLNGNLGVCHRKGYH